MLGGSGMADMNFEFQESEVANPAIAFGVVGMTFVGVETAMFTTGSEIAGLGFFLAAVGFSFAGAVVVLRNDGDRD